MHNLLTAWCFLLLLFGGLAVLSYAFSDEHEATIRRAQVVLSAPAPMYFAPVVPRGPVNPNCILANGSLSQAGPCR